ncbi:MULTISPECIES: DUF4166 domain-containing protein [unclassified Paenibacillus]|uniref:DUF4166 domain-containing protein n=1 Tax=unclassified Paenibacillus TaxID=185978 RepID=UPI00104F1975|nr:MULTISPECIES: DUF4166 domain-containing protein [unclassified Paenibacillus]NIK71515.1 hypothetical protein [Paenibacillus sp. BK720]TCM96163.1 uncharacterized protein DUF4166 [Paenibacillus sp. BK033]
MTGSIYEQALGARFNNLHPRIQERFGFSSKDRVASIGQGVMDRIWFNKWAAIPLALGASRHIMFPQGGSGIPFTIENYAYRDGFGRETVTWIRKFQFKRAIRHFDATMIYSADRNRVVDYLGNKQHLAVDLDITAASNGGIRIRSGDQRFYEGPIQFTCPALLTGTADVTEWYDDDREKFRISVIVSSPVLGTVFHYEGSFEAELIPLRHIPADAKPLREEARE